MHKAAIRIAAGIVALVMFSPAQAQDRFPSRPIRIVVGYSAGGGNDIFARLISTRMSERLGQPVVVENRPGAESAIAAELVARSPADGYTLLSGASGPMTVAPAMHSKLKYSPKDFVPISIIGEYSLMLVVSSQMPVKSVKELIEYAKANPAKVNYSSTAPPFQLVTELFKQKTGTKFEHIPYKGGADAVNAVASGEVTMAINNVPTISIQLKSGRLRGLAVTTAERMPGWPEVPTMSEAGVTDMVFNLWIGLVAPAATPPAIVRRLQQEVAYAVRLPDTREKMRTLGITPVGNTSEEFGAIIAAELKRWTEIATAAKLRD